MRKPLPNLFEVPTIAWIAATLLIAWSWPAPAAAEPLWKLVTPGQRVEADPAADYRLTEENGPWVILATTFSGDGAVEQAHELILELRRRYKLEAYQHEKSFDFSGSVQARGVDRFGDPVRMRYQKNRKIREIAVLVGNYLSVDDPAAQKTLRRIKTLQPQALDIELRKQTSQTLAALRKIQTTIASRVDPRNQKGPMSHAFVTRNPLLPQEYFVPRGVDKFVEQLNQGVTHSLLDCKGQVTVKVATFTGSVVLASAKSRSSRKGRKLKRSSLEVAAEKAQRLTLALREKGWDAYEFHDRFESIVTVGSFDEQGKPTPDGSDAGRDRRSPPSVQTIVRTFGARFGKSNFHPKADRFQAEAIKQTFHTAMGENSAQIAAGFEPKSLIEIPFDIDPQVISVPRRSIGSAYVRRAVR